VNLCRKYISETLTAEQFNFNHTSLPPLSKNVFHSALLIIGVLEEVLGKQKRLEKVCLSSCMYFFWNPFH
jgi:hypothetical protein